MFISPKTLTSKLNARCRDNPLDCFVLGFGRSVCFKVCVCVCLFAEMDRGFEVSDSQLQGQQRLSNDLPQETVSAPHSLL